MRRRFLLAFVLLAFTSQLQAANAGKILVDEARLYGRDALGLVRAPLGWDAATWRKVGILAAADGAAFASDDHIARLVQRNRNSTTDDIAGAVTQLGGGRALQLSAATLLAGFLTHNPQMRDTGRDAVEASILAAGVVTPAIKRIVGRSRPNAGEGAYAFDPLGNAESFPSGHATNAFAVASVFAAHAHGWLVPTIAYSLATTVAAARVNDNVHFTSDVIAGAAIGTMIGRSIVARHRQAAASTPAPAVTWSLAPMTRGLAIQILVPPSRIVHALARR